MRQWPELDPKFVPVTKKEHLFSKDQLIKMEGASAAHTANIVAKGKLKRKPNTKLQYSSRSYLSEARSDCMKRCKYASATARASHRSRLWANFMYLLDQPTRCCYCGTTLDMKRLAEEGVKQHRAATGERTCITPSNLSFDRRIPGLRDGD